MTTIHFPVPRTPKGYRHIPDPVSPLARYSQPLPFELPSLRPWKDICRASDSMKEIIFVVAERRYYNRIPHLLLPLLGLAKTAISSILQATTPKYTRNLALSVLKSNSHVVPSSEAGIIEYSRMSWERGVLTRSGGPRGNLVLDFLFLTRMSANDFRILCGSPTQDPLCKLSQHE